MKVKTNTKLFQSSTIFVNYAANKNMYYYISRPRSHKKSFAYDERITNGLTYKIYKNLLLAVIEKGVTHVTYDLI